MPVSKATPEELAAWDKQLEADGLSMSAGDDPHVMKYGFSLSELEDLPYIPEHVHQESVRLNLQELRRQRHASRTNQRAKLRDEKARIRQAIWGKSTT